MMRPMDSTVMALGGDVKIRDLADSMRNGPAIYGQDLPNAEGRFENSSNPSHECLPSITQLTRSCNVYIL